MQGLPHPTKEENDEEGRRKRYAVTRRRSPDEDHGSSSRYRAPAKRYISTTPASGNTTSSSDKRYHVDGTSHHTYTAPVDPSHASSPPNPRRNDTLDALRYQECQLVMDTCSLIQLHNPAESLDRIVSRHCLRIPFVIIHELDKMSKGVSIPGQPQRIDENLRHRCRAVRNWLDDRLTDQSEERQTLANQVPKVSLQRREDVHEPFQRNVLNNDDSALGFAVFLRVRGMQQGSNGSSPPVLLVTEDKMLTLKARAEKVAPVSIGDVLAQM